MQKNMLRPKHTLIILIASCLWVMLFASCDEKKQPERTEAELKELLANDSVPEGVMPIVDFLPGDTNRMMDRFYKALSHAKEMNRPVRIAYYGDSFIGGDILTQDLRELLQKEFGGSGCGAAELVPLYSRLSCSQSSKGLTSHNITVKSDFKNDLQGIDNIYTTSEATASAKLTGVKNNYSSFVGKWTKTYLYFRPIASATVTCTMNGETKEVYSGKSDKLQTACVEGETSSVEWGIKGSGNVFYFASNEGKNGIVLDNFGLVAVSGNQLNKIPQSTLEEFAAVRPYDLIILQYGLNVASPKELDNYKYYVRSFNDVIKRYQKAWPEAAILVVSVSDRATKDNGVAKSMKCVQELSQVQRKMAESNKLAFWDMYSVMQKNGGVVGMANRGEAEKDYTHLTHKGGKALAKPMFDALKNGLENYERRVRLMTE